MKLGVHLMFSGQCEAAFRFYEHCFAGTFVTMLTYGNSPLAEQVPLDWREKIVHATLTFGENTVAGADVLPQNFEPARGFLVLIDIDDPSEAERVFRQLSENGSVQMPIRETFWATRFGVLVDQFGIPWEITCGRAMPNAST